MSAHEGLKAHLSNVNGTTDPRTSDTGKSDAQPEGRPLTPAPGDSKARTELAKRQLRDLKPTMVSQSVNKTALHPGGVQYVSSSG